MDSIDLEPVTLSSNPNVSNTINDTLNGTHLDASKDIFLKVTSVEYTESEHEDTGSEHENTEIFLN